MTATHYELFHPEIEPNVYHGLWHYSYPPSNPAPPPPGPASKVLYIVLAAMAMGLMAWQWVTLSVK